MTELDDTQKAKVAEWLDEGLKLSEIQGRLVSEFGAHLTYMELRFLVDDLQLKVADVEPPPDSDATKAGDDEASGAGADDLGDELPDEPLGGPGNVSVTVDQVTRPGSVVSGKVRFSDGKSAAWNLDQFGRLGLAPEQEGYKPAESDIQAFQMELQKQLQRSGF